VRKRGKISDEATRSTKALKGTIQTNLFLGSIAPFNLPLPVGEDILLNDAVLEEDRVGYVELPLFFQLV